jgi:phospholipase/carboxylesterase
MAREAVVLEYESIVPPGTSEGAPLLVLMHGRGSDRWDLLGLGEQLAPGAVVVCPQAPWPGAPWGYGPGWAWYRFLGRNLPEPESFAASQARLGEFLAEMRSQFPMASGPMLLGGFSQGGVMAMSHALLNPGTVPRVLNFSGFLAGDPSVRATPETVAGTRFFWGHGLADQSIPHFLAVEGRALLDAAGADLTARDYPIAHAISADEVREARAWLAS